ncbi:hypothetical protein DAPPUDRAFT_256954 [Daphnia pulex]|uniref:Uncharacterized protein n=1 Tax=Daphnia pulex TaxID=6669 RepID=E9HCK4_DAPPU|nr:hypothetical protein DAPPUDRAFT_256954 [Daphnia pulex]|eukprot:EFX70489.1 hypothetical protein DAPPUDRAFT_256954 [Daphnia pulex]
MLSSPHGPQHRRGRRRYKIVVFEFRYVRKFPLQRGEGAFLLPLVRPPVLLPQEKYPAYAVSPNAKNPCAENMPCKAGEYCMKSYERCIPCESLYHRRQMAKHLAQETRPNADRVYQIPESRNTRIIRITLM